MNILINSRLNPKIICIIIDLYLIWNMRRVYQRRFYDVVQYREKLTSAPQSLWKGFVWSRKYYLRDVAWKSGSSNLDLLFQTVPIHGRAWYKQLQKVKWCQQIYWSKWRHVANCLEISFRLIIYVSFVNSGNVVIETKFFDDDLLVSTSRVRLFYV